MPPSAVLAAVLRTRGRSGVGPVLFFFSTVPVTDMSGAGGTSARGSQQGRRGRGPIMGRALLVGLAALLAAAVGANGAAVPSALHPPSLRLHSTAQAQILKSPIDCNPI